MNNNNVIAGRYELIEKIGDGGMAMVYKAKCRLLKRYVAVKILKPEFIHDAKLVESFRRESHAAASLSHPNIVSIFDVGREGNIHYIVMELVTGCTLSDLIAQNAPFEYKKAIEITKQIAAGLSAAHKHGLVHRDVKPHNILITSDGIAKITDFGIAKAVSNTTIVDKTNDRVMGSVHYFSPEQARGGDVDERSDIYSLGIVLFEMLTGRVPFDGDNPVTIALMQINEKITPPSAFVRGIPPQLEKVVLKATDKNPANRFQRADELIKTLDNLELVGRVVGDSVYGAAAAGAAGVMGASAAKAKTLGQDTDYIKDFSDDDLEDDYENYKKEKKKKSKAKPKKKKSSNGGGKKGLIAAVCIVLALAVGAVAYFGFFGKKDIPVPDVTGMTYEEAEFTLRQVDLRIEIGEYVYSDEYKADRVVSQNPNEGEMARKNQKVVVEISKGSERGIVPDLIGKTRDEAERMIREYGYELGQVSVEKGSEEKDTVIKQDPKVGTEAKNGTVINIVLSDGTGNEEVPVPNLLGMTLDQAKDALTREGFQVGNISYGVSDTYGEGEVMWQQFGAGTKQPKDTKINIRISQGQSSTVDLYVDFGSAKEDVFYMTVTVSDDNGTRNIVTRAQKRKSDGGETVRVKGSGTGTITVIFDDETVMKKDVNFAAGDVG